MNFFEQKVYNFIKQQRLSMENICVALSGGADSTALLLLLKRLGYNVFALHVNHQIRGDEADRDEQCCRSLCKRHQVPLTVVRADVPGRAKREKISTELAARNARYEAFCSVNCNIATAHTASDNAETVMYNLSRGTGIAGLYIPVCRPLENGKSVVRPLLCVTGKETAEYVQSQNESFVTDSSNSTDDYTRNIIRHRVMPTVKQHLGEDFEKSVLTLSLSAAADERALCNIAAESGIANENVLSVKALQKAPHAVSVRAVRRALSCAGIKQISAAAIFAVLALADSERPSAKASLSGGFTAYRRYDSIFIEKTLKTERKSFEIELHTGYNITPYGKINVTVRENIGEIHNGLTKLCISCDKIENMLIARNRKEGDKITLSGGTKTLKRLMIDKKIPREIRHTLPVICDGGRVVAAIGLGVDVNYLAKNKADKVAFIEFEGDKI